jgi:pyrrolysine biosynthesis protein PylD
VNGVTRLKKEDIMDIIRKLPAYDADLVRKTGLSLKEIASSSIEDGEKKVTAAISSHKVAVVPITSGEGVIENFVEAVEGILIHIGVNAFKTRDKDIAGLVEGLEKGADIVFEADDNRFIALNFHLRRIIDNVEATAKGYVSALEAMAGDLSQRQVLVIGGAGRVGWNAALYLEKKRAKVATIDLNQDRMELLVKGHEITVERNLEEALSRYRVFFDASPSANIIQAKHIKPETFIAAPGIPLGLSEEAYLLVKERLIHDVLEIGVATMFVHASCVQ